MRLTGLAAKIFHFSSKDNLKPGTYISMPLSPGEAERRYIRLDVPFVHQGHINLCGDACLNMLLMFNGRQPLDRLEKDSRGANRLAVNPRGILQGMTTEDLMLKASSFGLNPAGDNLPVQRMENCELLVTALKKYGPLIVSGREKNDVVGHFMLLTGVHEDVLFLHDPWEGPNRTMTREQFNDFIDWTDPESILAFIDLEAMTRRAAEQVQARADSSDRGAAGTVPSDTAPADTASPADRLNDYCMMQGVAWSAERIASMNENPSPGAGVARPPGRAR